MKAKEIQRNELQLMVQTKFRTLVRESKKTYKRSRDKKVVW